MLNEKSDQNNEYFTCPIGREEFCEDIDKRVHKIAKEFADGFVFVTNYPKSVSFFGSARFTPDNPNAQKAEHLAGRIAKELGYAVVTGGSAGIMAAANKGAFEAGGQSLGLNIKLPHEQLGNGYTTASLDFSFFFSRKTALSYAAEAYVFLPGGFGTLDELFEIITLVQTHKIRRVPIFLVGTKFWEPLGDFIKLYLYEIYHTINKNELDLYKITDDEDEIISIIREAPVSDGMHHRKKKEEQVLTAVQGAQTE